jgi:polar amino acid transport system substrate-binding protein
MEFFSNGTSGDIVGFDADGTRALANYWGLKIALANTAFPGLLPALNSKRCDMVWTALYLSKKRLAVADGAVYMNTGPGLIAAAGNPKKVTDLNSLCGLTIAVQSASANEGFVKDQSTACQKAGKKTISIQSYPKGAETVAAVTNGKADALVETDVAVADMVSKSGGKLEEVRNVFPTSTQFAVYTNKGSSISAPLKSAIADLVANGTLATIASKYGLDSAKLTSEAKPLK